jgi:peptidyl-prolyl cis-trans isomerase A (cyclophilin A)
MGVRLPILFAAAWVGGLAGCDGAGSASDGEVSSASSAMPTAPPQSASASQASVPVGPPLLNPSANTETAPDTYQVALDTTRGTAVIKVTRSWAPRGADRFYNLVKVGYYTNVAFYRVTLEVAQFGIHADPKVTAAWRQANLLDEQPKQPNRRGMVTFARSRADTRTTQVFINLKDNAADFDPQGFAPFGEVIEGMDVIDKLSHEHGERPQQGDAPKRMMSEGGDFIKKEFPKLDYIKTATLRP